MKSRKTALAFILIAVLVVTVYAQQYNPESDFTVDADGVITKYIGFDTDVVIPATIGGKKITAIGERAFQKADLTSVTIPEGVTRIGYMAFADNKLTSVTIPNSVMSIDYATFRDNQLTSVTIPNIRETARFT
jgi:hypothetical protein